MCHWADSIQNKTKEQWAIAHWDLPPSPQSLNPLSILRDNVKKKQISQKTGSRLTGVILVGAEIGSLSKTAHKLSSGCYQ